MLLLRTLPVSGRVLLFHKVLTTMLQFIFLQAAQPGSSSPLLSMLFPFLILIVFYFFLIRPQIKRQKETQKFQEALREGLEVVTNSGIIGKITKIDGPVVRLMVDEKTFIRVVKSAIQGEYKAGQ